MDKIADIPSAEHFISILALPQSTKSVKEGGCLILRQPPFCVELLTRVELVTSSLPRMRSTN